MRKIETSIYEVMERLIGEDEVRGDKDNPLILAMLQRDNDWPEHDEVPWCSAALNFCAEILGVARSKDLRARSWLRVGQQVSLEDAEIGADIVVIKRGKGEQPGPEVINAPGHVGCFAGYDGDRVFILGGNQSDSISIAPFPKKDILGVRRLY